MPDREQGDHWDFLAADLGAVPPPENKKEEEQPAESPAVEEVKVVEELTFEASVEQIEKAAAADSAEAPPEKPEKRERGQRGGRVVSGFGYRRGGVDWANLARELGVEAMEEAPEPIPAADAPAVAETPAIVLPDEPILVEERGDRKSRPSWHPEPAAHPAVSGFGAGIIDDSTTEEATRIEGDKETGEGEESQEERKGRRRRRRRKPRRPDEEQTAETVSVEETESPAAEEPSEEEGARRRGRRRGGRKRSPREEVSAESGEFGAGLIADHPGQNDIDDFDMLLADDDEDEDEDDEDEFMDDDEDSTGEGEQGRDRRQGKRVVHRGIPSWEESVGHIINSNMESRSKRPEPSGPRQHSGRRRGGDRNSNRKRS